MSLIKYLNSRVNNSIEFWSYSLFFNFLFPNSEIHLNKSRHEVLNYLSTITLLPNRLHEKYGSHSCSSDGRAVAPPSALQRPAPSTDHPRPFPATFLRRLPSRGDFHPFGDPAPSSSRPGTPGGFHPPGDFYPFGDRRASIFLEMNRISASVFEVRAYPSYLYLLALCDCFASCGLRLFCFLRLTIVLLPAWLPRPSLRTIYATVMVYDCFASCCLVPAAFGEYVATVTVSQFYKN
jgi:hypothetical protein